MHLEAERPTAEDLKDPSKATMAVRTWC